MLSRPLSRAWLVVPIAAASLALPTSASAETAAATGTVTAGTLTFVNGTPSAVTFPPVALNGSDQISSQTQTLDVSDARVAPRTSVDAAPTRQRITELRAAGHTLPDLANRLGRTPTSLARTLRRASVTVSTDRAVAALHRQLSPPPPGPVNWPPRGFA